MTAASAILAITSINPMQKIVFCCIAGGSLLSANAVAQAQTQAPAAQAVVTTPSLAKAVPLAREAAADATPSVSVTAQRPTYRIHRQVYDVKSDVSSSNETASDALNNVPSVAVDPAARYTARQQQCADPGRRQTVRHDAGREPRRGAPRHGRRRYRSVEVINNPGAQFGNEAGGGPILNLVMRRNRKPGGFCTVNANAGTAGRYNSAASGTTTRAPGASRAASTCATTAAIPPPRSARPPRPSTGGSSATAIVHRNGLNDLVGANGTVNYNLKPTTRWPPAPPTRPHNVSASPPLYQ